MANNSMLAADGVNPKAAILGAVNSGERSPLNNVAIKLTHSDIPTSGDTYVLAKLPVGCAVTNCYWVVSTAFSNLVDIGITNSSGAAGTDGNVDILIDGSTKDSKAVGISRADASTHASNNYAGHLCITDSYVTLVNAGAQSAGAGTLVVEYVEAL